MKRTCHPSNVGAAFLIAGLVSTLTGCQEDIRKEATKRYYQRQEEALEKTYAEWWKRHKKETAEWDRQNKVLKEQEKAYATLLGKWKDQAERMDRVLDRWENVLDAFEGRLDTAVTPKESP